MPIIGPFPDGGYELWCGACHTKITCLDPRELKNQKKQYEKFICKDYLPIIKIKHDIR